MTQATASGNQFKPKPAEPVAPKAKKPSKASQVAQHKVVKQLGDVVSGSFLKNESVVQTLPFLFFLCLMALLYIFNGYYAEEKVRELNKVTNELKELRSEYITSKSDLMFISKQSEVAKAAQVLGIKESVEPPIKIVYKQDTTQVATAKK